MYTNYNAFSDEFLWHINQARTQGAYCGQLYMPPVQPLYWNGLLAAAAYEHAADMAMNNYFGHGTLDGRSLQTRLNNVGYTIQGYQTYTIGENIAQGQRSIADVMHSWLSSPPHFENLMSANFFEVGIAEYNFYWVQNFGGRIPFAQN